MSRGFGGVPGNMQALVKQAQKMQQELVKAQEEAKAVEAEGSAGGGAVKILISGEYEVKSVKIEPSVVDSNDVEMLQDLVAAAFKEAIEKVKATTKDKLSKVTGGVNIPGLF